MSGKSEDPAELLALFEHSLDRTTPKKAILNNSFKNKKTLIKLPNKEKWQNYPRNRVIPFTISPANYSAYKSGPYWINLNTVSKKKNRILRVFKDFFKYCHNKGNETFKDVFIAWEFGKKSRRFHCHGFIYMGNITGADYTYWEQFVNLSLGDPKHPNITWNRDKNKPFVSIKESDFVKNYKYCTKDIQKMFDSLFSIKWTNYKTLVKPKYRFNPDALDAGIK